MIIPFINSVRAQQDINIPWNDITNPGHKETVEGFRLSLDLVNLGDIVGAVLNLIVGLSIFLAFGFLVWGAFSYLLSGGDKEKLGKAKNRLTYAIIGLIVTLIAFALAQFIYQVLTPTGPNPLSSLVQPVEAASINLGDSYGFSNVGTLGEFLSLLLPTIFSIFGVIFVVYFLWGAVSYLLSGGNKEAVAKAQAKITHSIIALLILILAFLIIEYLPKALGFNLSLF